MSVPCIACVGIVGKFDNPLHIAIFPPYEQRQSALLDFSFLLNASLDIFDARSRDPQRLDQDLGLLQVVNERLNIWGWQTGTGVRFAIIVDSWGKDGKFVAERQNTGDSKAAKSNVLKGVQNSDLKPAFKSLQTAYIRLLQNPFYTPDDHPPMAVAQGRGKGGEIKSPKFIKEIRRIGNAWRPGLTVV